MPRYSGNEIGKQLSKTIGKNIFCLRIARRLSRDELSKELNISHQQLHKYEFGNSVISAMMLFQIAQVLNAPIEYFYGNIKEQLKKKAPVRELDKEDAANQRIYLEITKNIFNIKNNDSLKALNKLIESFS